MSFNYENLRAKIKEVCGTHEEFAKRIGIGRVSLSHRLNNILEFDQREMLKSCEVLGINEKDIPKFFFTPEVQKIEQEEG